MNRTYRPEPTYQSHLPTRTTEQLAESGRTAVKNRQHRAQVMDTIATGKATVQGIRDAARDEENRHLGKIKAPGILNRIPGVGYATSARLCEEIGIDPRRRIRELGHNQIRRLDNTIRDLLATPTRQRPAYKPKGDQ